MKHTIIPTLLGSLALAATACEPMEIDEGAEPGLAQAISAAESGKAPGKHGRRGRRGPPQQAIEACASATEGATCSFEGRHGTVEGTCVQGPGDAGLACRPARGSGPHGRGGHRGPPPQAVEACASSAEGATCSFEGRRGAVEGTCVQGPGDAGLACRPARGSGPHGRGGHRGPPPQAVEACASSTEGATCSFEGRRGTVEGTCAQGPGGEGLACRPARGGGPRGPGGR